MQKCEKCHTPFTWGEIYRYEWRFSRNRNNNKLSCRECNTEHELTSESKWIFIPFFSVVVAVTVFYFGYRNPNSSIFHIILATIFAQVIISAVFPFIYKFQSKYHSNYKANP